MKAYKIVASNSSEPYMVIAKSYQDAIDKFRDKFIELFDDDIVNIESIVDYEESHIIE